MVRLVLLFFLFTSLWAKDVKVALSFDDFPMGSSLIYKKKERVLAYVEKLKKEGVSAVFFCIGEQLDSAEGRLCLEYLTPNCLLANHTYSHPTLSKISLEKFKEEVSRTEELLVEKEAFRKWFRFPYLDYGDRENVGGDDQKRLRAFQFLRETGYIHGYVTINTFDWYVDSKLKKAVANKKEINWPLLKKTYLELVESWLDDSHEKWSHSLKWDFVHVLLFHQNDINALYLEEIIGLIRKKNWVIVTPDEAFARPIRYLAFFPNSKGRLFKKSFSITLEYVDNLLITRNIFN